MKKLILFFLTMVVFSSFVFAQERGPPPDYVNISSSAFEPIVLSNGEIFEPPAPMVVYVGFQAFEKNFSYLNEKVDLLAGRVGVLESGSWMDYLPLANLVLIVVLFFVVVVLFRIGRRNRPAGAG
jgi:hypothetical protein